MLDFVRPDKTTLSYVRLHSAQEPGFFALLDNYRVAHRGQVASEAAFMALLTACQWEKPSAPARVIVKKEKDETAEERPRPEPPHPTAWRAGALGILAQMKPEGQQATLASWAKISKEAGGPFLPALPAPLVATSLGAEASELLADFTVLDLEFQAKPQALLELAAIRYQNWQPVGKVVSFVRCREELNPHVARLTGITRADVYNAPAEKAVLQAFFKLAEGSLLVAHNYIADKKQLEDARRRCGATTDLPNKWLCTLALARSRRSKGAPCGLGELCLDFNINTLGAHRAERDVQMCYQVLRHFHQQQPITELITSSAAPKAVRTGDLFATAA